jgi:DNA polymerase (family X)
MSNKQRWPAASARKVADELAAELASCCERIEVAGSLRRGKPDVGDIELLYIPKTGQVRVPGELFPKRGLLTDELVDQWLAKGIIAKRPNVNGTTAWGELNKLAVHVASGIPVDLFATTTERWFVSLVMRTGSAQSNTRLANAALKRGMQFHAYGVIQDRSGEQIIPQSEREVFERLGVPYREPAER